VTKMQGDRDDVDDDDSDSGRTMRDGVEVGVKSARCRTGGGGAHPRTPHDPLRGSPSQTVVLPLDLTDGSVIVEDDVGTEVVISTSSASSSGVVFSPLNLTVPRVDVG